ncbi:unnamed protein product [Parnassius mnemosyne]|uniref:RNA-directed DNA polymerase n=1 Tax=Parnassius mnemosyne TaxID=213953 RepID=A0AAV1L7E1_9NEOP
MPVDFKEISYETKKDSLLCKILGYVMFGWPPEARCEEEKPYFARKSEITTDLGCLLFKYRLIISPVLRTRVLKEVHDDHLGVNKMKNLSRNYVYWPSLESREEVCRNCEPCRVVRDAPPDASICPWEFPQPWHRIHADFAEYAGKKYLVIVDAHSKWIEVSTMKSTNAQSTIAAFRAIFSRFGLPSQLVTDNGPPFLSHDFKNYCHMNCIKQFTTAPYRPQGNGAVENAVKTIKKVVKRAVHEVSCTVNIGKGIKLRRHLDQVTPIKNKNRYSLTRTSQTSREEQTQGDDRNSNKTDVVCSDDEGACFDDASSGPIASRTHTPIVLDVTPYESAPFSEPIQSPTLTPPGPDASSRALRAFNRNKRNAKI